ncbi:Uncharacterised protein [[Clostridium] sordellii]|uniref:Uncharacterized protein n=1 Tax=bioreactor metagenome TaxID=1076179 RepID=A0A644VK52_9ZZZZ|nr:hypothetical protein [Paeniclostridium sordellii]CEQ26581.1 Uncharacterised protein [[Clostridium] sordellii] [Paeniclostridium sordellii]
MKLKELLAVSKFEEYNLGFGSFTKEEIEMDHKTFLDKEVTSIVPRPYTVRKFLNKKMYTTVLVDALVYLNGLNNIEAK